MDDLAAVEDAALLHSLFRNLRGVHPRGWRLSEWGLGVLQQLFLSYEVRLPPHELLSPRDFLYLDERCCVPYYFSGGKLVLFDQSIAALLLLMDGSVSLLQQVEPRAPPGAAPSY